MRLLSCCLTVAFLAVCINVKGSTKSQWEKHKREIVANPSLLRYYVFEEGQGDEVRNLASSAPQKMAMTGGPQGSLTILRNGPYAGPEMRSLFTNLKGIEDAPSPEWTQGRWPWKSALTNGLLPRCVFRSGFDGRGLDGFTIEAWIRIHKADKSCSIFSLDDNHPFDRGFKAWYSKGMFYFRLGTTAGKKIVSAKLSEGIWHQVVCGFGNGRLELFIDGKLVAACSLDGGKYAPPKERGVGGYDSRPFMEGGHCDYLQIGGRPHWPPNGGKPTMGSGTGRFDLGEFAIFKGAPVAVDVEERYQSGKPGLSEEEQLSAFRKLRDRTERLSKIKLDMPVNTWGYFPNGQDIPITVNIPKGSVDTDTCVVELTLDNLAGKRIWEETKSFKLDGKNDLKWETKFRPKLNDVYFLDMIVKDAKGKVVRRLAEKRCIGVSIPLLSKKDYLPGNPMMRWTAFPEPVWDYGMPFQAMCPWSKDWQAKAGNPPFPTNWFTIPRRTKPIDKAEAEKIKKGLEKVIAEHKDDVYAWGIAGEPDGFMTPDEYMKLLKICSNLIREKCPNALIVGANVTPLGGLPFIKEIMRQGAWKYFDVLGFHDYQSCPISKHRWNNKAKILKKVCREYAGKELPLWNTESCFLSLPRVGNRPMTWDEAFRIGFRGSTFPKKSIYTSVATLPESVAAARLEQQVLIGLAEGFLKYNDCHSPGLPGIQGTNTGGTPNLVGLALGTLSTLLNSFDKAEEMPLACLDEVCIIITSKNGRKLASLFSDNTPELYFQCEPDFEFKGVDMLGNPMSWRADSNGLLKLKLAEAPIYLFDLPAKFQQVPILKMAAPERLPDDGLLRGMITIHNPFKNELKGKLVFQTLEGAKIECADKQVNVAPGKSVELPFTLKAERLLRKSYALKCELMDGANVVATSSLAFDSEGTLTEIPEVSKVITLDGDDAEWRDLPGVTVDNEINVIRGKPNRALIWLPHWKGAEDLSFSLRCAWRPDDGVYVLIKVKDDRLMPAPPEHTGRGFQWDCLELFVDTRPDGLRGGPVSVGADQIVVIPKINDKGERCELWYTQKENAKVEATFVGRRTQDGYVLEGKLVPKPGSALKLQPGTRFNMDATIDDLDVIGETPRSPKTIMALNGTPFNYVNSNAWSRFELGAPLSHKEK